MLTDHWPLYGLRLTIADLELRLPNAEELAELADVAAAGVHRPGEKPFLSPWTDAPPAELARGVIQRHWARLGGWTPQSWVLELAVFHHGRPVGSQDVRSTDFGILREVATGSWLGLPHQGQGIGTRMRAAVLELAFAGLGATDATTAALADSPASFAVSEKSGYRADGISRDVQLGKAVVSRRLRLRRADWEASTRPEVGIEGLPPCLELFGAVPA